MVTEAHGPPLPVPLWYVALSMFGAIVMMATYGMPLENGNFWPEGPLLAYLLVAGVIGSVLGMHRAQNGEPND